MADIGVGQKGTNVLAFSFWNALWIVFISFLFIVVLMMMFTAIVDLFRDDQLGGVGKAMWILLLIFLPLFGLLIYTIVKRWIASGLTSSPFAARTRSITIISC